MHLETLRKRDYHVLLFLPFLLLALTPASHAAEVLYIHGSPVSAVQNRRLESAAEFYGLKLISVTTGLPDSQWLIRKAFGKKTTSAVVISAQTLGSIDGRAFLESLNHTPGRIPPLLVLGVTPETNRHLLDGWSGGAATECKRVTRPGTSAIYKIGNFDGMTKQLSNRELPAAAGEIPYFSGIDEQRVSRLIDVQTGRSSYPQFIGTRVSRVQVFLSCAGSSPAPDTPREWTAFRIVAAFADIAPEMMFLRYAAADAAWHAPYHYANLTIDDPWLRTSYGSVRYGELLAEMQEHNFHTTIAFIPWNYDRSDPQVVSLFREHPDRFSISVHGNDHDHKEFTDYREKPLAVQALAVRQSVCRMERFKALTGIPFDRVMVFPHSIAPENTLRLLKNNNYLATFNSSNVPMDRDTLLPVPLAFRPVTLSFAAFPSVRRYPTETPMPLGFIAVNQFLDNPLFLYCHQDFFGRGIQAFDEIADEVNSVEPDVRWRGLGEITQHLYWLRQRTDLDYDVAAFSSDFYLTNPSDRSSLAYVTKEEAGEPSLSSVTTDGQSALFQLEDGRLSFTVSLPARGTRHIIVGYDTDVPLRQVDTSRRSVRVYFLRKASDFRDIFVSRYRSGQALVRFYSTTSAKRVWVVLEMMVLLLFLAVLCGFIVIVLRRFYRMQRTPTRPQEDSSDSIDRNSLLERQESHR